MFGMDFQNTPLKQSRLLTKNLSQYGHNNYEPKTIKSHLPYCKLNVNIICLDIRQAIYSLLSDEELMVQNNLMFLENLFEDHITILGILKILMMVTIIKLHITNGVKKKMIYCVL